MRPGNRSMQPDFGDNETLNKILKDAGFKNIDILSEEKTFYYKDGEEWWQEQLSHAGRTSFDILERMGNGLLDKFKKELLEEFDKEFGNRGIPLEGEVLIALGNK